jgi:hypothetical protein
LYIANRLAIPNGKGRGTGRGGRETNNFLISRGFKIVTKDGTRISAQPNGQQPSSNATHGSYGKVTTKGGNPKSKNPRVSLKKLFDPSQLDFEVRTPERVRMARKLEAELVKGYRQWLEKKSRELKVANYQGLRCDAYEEERNNLIEAKSSGRREYIRMAVGQLLDYAYLGRKQFGRPNMAILLPRKPEAKLQEWLAEAKISVIWTQRRAFFDNANGQFI